MTDRSSPSEMGALERTLRWGSVALVVTLACYTAIEISRRVAARWRWDEAERSVKALLEAPPERWREAIGEVARLRTWTAPLLETWTASGPGSQRGQLAVHLARHQMGDDRNEWTGLLSECEPSTLTEAASVLRPARRELIDALWKTAEDEELPPGRRLRIAGLLATLGSLDAPRWKKLSALVADQLIAATAVRPDEYTPLSALLDPAGERLLDDVLNAAGDTTRPAAERLVAVRWAVEFCRDDPLRLVDLLAAADAEQLTVLRPALLPLRDRAGRLLGSGRFDAPAPTWDDPPMAVDGDVGESTAMAVRAAGGWIDERFAYCQTLRFAEFSAVSAELSRSGYRPSRVRPYHASNGLLAAAIWLRDGRAWRIQDGTSDVVRGHGAALRSEGFCFVDVAGYLADPSASASTPRYVALWAEAGDTEPSSEVYLGVSRAEHAAQLGRFKDAGMRPRSLQVFQAADDGPLFNGVWMPGKEPFLCNWSATQDRLTEELATSRIVIDVGPYRAPAPETTGDRCRRELAAAETALQANPDDVNLRQIRARAHAQLGNDTAALEDLNWVINKNPTSALAYGSRAIVLARMGKMTEARTDLAVLKERKLDASFLAYYAAVVAAHGGEEEQTLADLDAIGEARDGGQVYNACCAYSILSGLVASRDADRGKAYADRAAALLERSVELGYREFSDMETDADLDPIRAHPRVSAILDRDQSRWRYPFVSVGRENWEGTSVSATDPAEHVERGRVLSEQGYRPLSLAVARDESADAWCITSLWHRPRVDPREYERWANRQAGLIALRAEAGDLGPLVGALREDADPDLRIRLIHMLAKVGIAPESLLDRFRSESNSAVRAALLQALGEFSEQPIPPPRREALLPDLLTAYRTDPDREVHASVKWLLGRWGWNDRVAEEDRQLASETRNRSCHWYVTGQGHTMIVLDSRTSFQQGSPGFEPERGDDEPRHSSPIESPFSIGDFEVTVGQYQRFLADHPEFATRSPDSGQADDQTAQTGVTWYAAAAYCNWLSRQEGIPEDQWCYEPNPEGRYAEGMRAVPDVQHRGGYRLPLEAEWEYACRAATETAFGFGRDADLLPSYGWFKSNSDWRVSSVGLLKPNRWGLFDMHGNVAEWCHDRHAPYPLDRSGNPAEKTAAEGGAARVLRGGSFLNLGRYLRSAARQSAPPGTRYVLHGFRVVRVLPATL